MTDKFLGSSGDTSLSDGSAVIVAASLSASNFDPSLPIRTDAAGALETSLLLISDTDGLAAALAAGTNHFNRTGTILSPKVVGDELAIDVINEETGSGNGVTVEGVLLDTGAITLGSGISVSEIIDDDTMGTASATNLCSGESIKAYIDGQIGGEDHWDRVGTVILPHVSGDELAIDIINEETGSGNGVTVEGVKFDTNTMITTGDINVGRIGIDCSPSAKVCIKGTDSSFVDGAAIGLRTDLDVHPLMQYLAYNNSALAMYWNCYNSGSGVTSSYSGSNFGIVTYLANWYLQYGSGVAKGAAVTLNTAMSLNASTGNILFPGPEIDMTGDLKVDTIQPHTGNGNITIDVLDTAAQSKLIVQNSDAGQHVNLEVEGAITVIGDASGDPLFVVNRAAGADVSNIQFQTGAVETWSFRQTAGSGQLRLYNAGTSNEIITFNNGNDMITTYDGLTVGGTLKTDTIQPKTANGDLTIDVLDDSLDSTLSITNSDGTYDVELELNGGAVKIDGFIDDDTMATASDSTLATSESIKAYVDSSGALWQRVGTDLSPNTAGDALKINTIKPDTANGDITIDVLDTGADSKLIVTNSNVTYDAQLQINASTAVDGIIDDDDMTTASATTLATSESIKAYVDSQSGGGGFSEGFSAYRTTDQSNITGDGTDATCIWNLERFDTGGNYNTSTGVYTAPSNGKYIFTVHVGSSSFVNSTHTSTDLELRVSGVDYEVWYDDISYTGYKNGGGTVIVSMTTGQTAQVQWRVNGSSKVIDMYSYGDSFFMGGKLSD